MIREDEIVEYPDMSKGEEYFRQQQERNREAKMRHAERREREWLESKHFFIDGIVAIVQKMEKVFKKNKSNQQKQNTR